jgi:hypothetical protein
MNPDILYTVARQNTSSKVQLAELDELIAKYPWFSVAHLLKAKGMMQGNDPDYPEQLQRASVHVNDRQVLFDFLHDHSDSLEVNPVGLEDVEPIAASQVVGVIEEEIKIEPSANDQVQAQQEEQIGAEETIVEEEVLPTENEGSDLIPAATLPEIEDVEIEQPAPIALQEEEEQEIEQVIVQEIAQPPANDVEGDLKKVEEVDPELEKEILAGAVSRIIEKEVQESVEEDRSLEVKSVPSASELDDEADLSPFARRLLSGAAKMGYGAPMEHNAAPFDVEDQKELNQNLTSDELVEAFIRSSPRITPSRAPEYSPSDLAKQSLIEDDSFVTETMAKIYAQQGKIEKAKKAYKLLSLKYPEKSIYFALQLKKLGKNK